MKALGQSILLTAIAIATLGQGTINFNNRVTTSGIGGQAPVVAPIFGLDAGNPFAQKVGLPDQTWYTSTYGVNAPVVQDGLGHFGTPGLTYGGPALTGTGFSAALWAITSDQPDSALNPNDPAKAEDGFVAGSLVFFGPRTTTGLAFRGYWVPPADPVAIPGVIGGAGDPTRIKYQVRVWCNAGGTLTTWAEVLAVSGSIRAYSPVIFLDEKKNAVATENALSSLCFLL